MQLLAGRLGFNSP